MVDPVGNGPQQDDVLAQLDGERQPGTGPPARQKPAGRWGQRIAYDPDAKSSSDKFLTDAPTMAKRFSIVIGNVDEKKHATEIPGTPGSFIAKEVAGVVLVPSREGNRWRPVEVNSYADLKSLTESRAGKDKQMLESTGELMREGHGEPYTGPGFTGGGTGPSADHLWGEDFQAIIAGPYYKQLYVYDYLKMHSTAFEMVNHSALAAAAIRIYERFTIGRGISYAIKDDEVRKIWEEFWRRNNMKQRFKQMARDYPWQGEMMIRFYEKQRGYTSVRLIDPSTCWEVITDPEDLEHVYYYHFQWPTPYQTWVTGKIPTAKYIIQQVPPTNIIHLKGNISSQEKRGRSMLLAAFPWIRRFNDFYNGQTIKAVLEANLVFKIKVKGDQTDVDSFLQNPALTELPPPGGVWIENEMVDLNPVTAQLTGGRGSTGIGQQLASITAASLNLPNEYFNIEAGAGGARATALVRTDPAVKAIEDMQQTLKEAGERVFEHVIADALKAGRLDRRKAKYSNPDMSNDAEDDPEDSEDQLLQPSRMIRTVRR